MNLPIWNHIKNALQTHDYVEMPSFAFEQEHKLHYAPRWNGMGAPPPLADTVKKIVDELECSIEHDPTKDTYKLYRKDNCKV